MGDRVQDVVDDAGGLLPDADPSAINLATLLTDEMHLHVPVFVENPVPTAPAESSVTSALIDINAAPQSLLETLPGIGAVRAQAIVDYRESVGPFSTTLDIMNVQGIGPATFKDISHLIHVSQGR